MAHDPGVGDEVILDLKIVRAKLSERHGTIINRVERRVKTNKYEMIYFVRTWYDDVFQVRKGEFIMTKRRHLEPL